MELRKKIEGEHLKVWFGERFMFNDYDRFRELIEVVKTNNKVQQVDIYLQALSFLDSAALGMLLLIKDVVSESEKKLTLYHPQGQVKKLFEISCFYELFEIIDSIDKEDDDALDEDRQEG